MSNQDNLAHALSAINNAEKAAKNEVVVKPAYKLILAVLEFMKKEGYVKSFDVVENTRGGEIKVKLMGNINKVGVIKPRFSVKSTDMEKFEKRYLPARDFGRIIVSTPKGLVDHMHVKENKVGGRVIAYIY